MDCFLKSLLTRELSHKEILLANPQGGLTPSLSTVVERDGVRPPLQRDREISPAVSKVRVSPDTGENYTGIRVHNQSHKLNPSYPFELTHPQVLLHL